MSHQAARVALSLQRSARAHSRGRVPKRRLHAHVPALAGEFLTYYFVRLSFEYGMLHVLCVLGVCQLLVPTARLPHAYCAALSCMYFVPAHERRRDGVPALRSVLLTSCL